MIRLVQRFVPVSPQIDGDRFWVRHEGVLYATPLFVALVFIEFSDIIFAIDSVPAIFALTNEPLIVFTSNIFAILGLRAMYFLLASAVQCFSYLKYGLGVILVFVGLKMVWLNQAFGGKFPIALVARRSSARSSRCRCSSRWPRAGGAGRPALRRLTRPGERQVDDLDVGRRQRPAEKRRARRAQSARGRRSPAGVTEPVGRSCAQQAALRRAPPPAPPPSSPPNRRSRRRVPSTLRSAGASTGKCVQPSTSVSGMRSRRARDEHVVEVAVNHAARRSGRPSSPPPPARRTTGRRAP